MKTIQKRSVFFNLIENLFQMIRSLKTSRNDAGETIKPMTCIQVGRHQKESSDLLRDLFESYEMPQAEFIKFQEQVKSGF